DRFDVPQGAVAAASIMAQRRGYTGPIEVSVICPKGITGKATIQAGQPVAPNLPAALLLIHAQADTAVGAYPIVIQGKATIDGKTIIRYASVRTVVSQTLANLPYPPRHLNNQLAVAVTEKPPFTLSVKVDQPEVVRGLPATVTVTAVRAAGF